MDFIQPSLSEIEKIKEEKLISDIQSLNQSFKLKNTEKFLNALNEIYLENFEGNAYKNSLGTIEPSLLNSPNKTKRSFSYDNLENAEFELNLGYLNKQMGASLSYNKYESQSTNYMSYNSSKNSTFSNSESVLNFDCINNDNSHVKANSLSLIKTGFPKSNIENIISQNLIISDEVIKIIIIGEKGVGKTLFINKLCDSKNISQIYEPTQT